MDRPYQPHGRCFVGGSVRRALARLLRTGLAYRGCGHLTGHRRGKRRRIAGAAAGHSISQPDSPARGADREKGRVSQDGRPRAWPGRPRQRRYPPGTNTRPGQLRRCPITGNPHAPVLAPPRRRSSAARWSRFLAGLGEGRLDLFAPWPQLDGTMAIPRRPAVVGGAREGALLRRECSTWNNERAGVRRVPRGTCAETAPLNPRYRNRGA